MLVTGIKKIIFGIVLALSSVAASGQIDPSQISFPPNDSFQNPSATQNGGSLYISNTQINNGNTLRATVTKIANMTAAAPSQLRIATIGDSTSGQVAPEIVCQLIGATTSVGVNPFFAGFVGVGVSGIPQCAGTATGGSIVLSGDAAATGNGADYTHFINGTGYTAGTSSSGCVTWNVGGGYFPSNFQQVFYAIGPGLGTLTIDTNNNGAGWVNQATINTANATVAGAEWHQTVGSVAPYQIRTCGASGTVYIWNAGLTNTTINGVVTEWFGIAGTGMPDWASVPSALYTPIWAGLNPDLVIQKWELNGFTVPNTCTVYTSSIPIGSAQSWYTWLNQLNAQYIAANVNVDTLILGQWPAGTEYDINQCMWKAAQDSAYWAYNHNQTFVDEYYQIGPGSTQTNSLGWYNGSTPHYTASGAYAAAMLALQRLGITTWPYINATRDVNNSNTQSTTFYIGTAGNIQPGAANVGTVFNNTNGANATWKFHNSTSNVDPALFSNQGSVLMQFTVGDGAGSNSTAFIQKCATNVLAVSGASAGCATGQDFYIGGLLLGQNNQGTASGTVTITPASGTNYRYIMSGNLTISENAQGNDVFWVTVCQPGSGGPFTITGGTRLGYMANIPYPTSANSCVTEHWIFDSIDARAYLAGGPIYSNAGNPVTPTLSAGCGTITGQNGGFSNGTTGELTFAAGQTSCIPVITTNMTAPHGWDCTAKDLTTPADTFTQTASSTTSCTVSGTVVSSDVILVRMTPY